MWTAEDFEIFGAPEFQPEEPCPSTVRSAWEVYANGERVTPESIGLKEDDGVDSIPSTLPTGEMPSGKMALIVAGKALGTLASLARVIETGQDPFFPIEEARRNAIDSIDYAMSTIVAKLPGQSKEADVIRSLIIYGLRGRNELEADSAWFTMMASFV